jgi:MoxR-like ATPase
MFEADDRTGDLSDLDEIPVFQRRFDRLADNVEKFVRGKSDVVRLALICLFAEGHLLLEDVPGLAKTSLARAIARSVTAKVGRIQFTPDLLPSDVTGFQRYTSSGDGPGSFQEGPVFANILIGDEINRASPKTQSALLEVMAEGQVTVGGATYRVPQPFLCIATQNPVEYQGTYPLPEAQLDRFMMRIGVGYPAASEEVSIVEGGLSRRTPEQLQSVMTINDMQEMIRTVGRVHVSNALQQYVVRLTRATRAQPDVIRLGVSPRGSIGLALCAQARAASLGRSYALPEDVKAMAVPVLNHRLILTPDAVVRGVEPAAVIRDLLSAVAQPASRDGWS